jgi:hypothetical protein
LEDSERHAAFAYGEPTDLTLPKFARVSLRTNATVHPCPIRPEKTVRTTIGHEPAIFAEMYCPASGGPFVLTAFVIHAGFADVFFTYTNARGSEADTRSWFRALLGFVSFKV